jgi:hypothetical protein
MYAWAAANASGLRDELLDGEIFYTLREAQIRHRELATPLQCCFILPISLCH